MRHKGDAINYFLIIYKVSDFISSSKLYFSKKNI